MSDQQDATALLETASSTLALLQRFTASLNDKSKDKDGPRIVDAPDPLDVLSDAATLLKAHTTKLSLLVINKPFTPSAIRKVITEVTSGCIPALISGVEICRPQEYGRILHDEVKFKVRRVLLEYEGIMREVVTRTQELQSGKSSNKARNKRQSRDSLASTGVVWEACDGLIALRAMGTVGVVVKKAEDYRAILQDALDELKEWGEGEDEGFSEPEEFSEDDETSSIERMMASNSKLPADRDDLKVTLATAMKRLKLVKTLYQALIKRRLKTIEGSAPAHEVSGCPVPPLAAIRVDEVMGIFGEIQEMTDELASVFYELDNDEAERISRVIVQKSRDAVSMVRVGWDTKHDEFTSWSDKWLEAIEDT